MSDAQNGSITGPHGEQRSDERIRYDFPVFFFFVTGKRRPREINYVKGYTQDVSETGIKLLVEAPAAETTEKLKIPESVVEAEIFLPAVFRSKPVVVRGNPVWTKPQPHGNLAVGFEFVTLDEKQRKILKRVAETLRDVTEEILGNGD